MNKKPLSEKEVMITNLERRIKFKKVALAKFKDSNRKVEAEFTKRIRLSQIQLDALRKR